MAKVELTTKEAKLVLKHLPIAGTEDGRNVEVIALKEKLAKAVEPKE